MTHGTPWSLKRRLSTWLAIETFMGLALVSVVVYIAASVELTSRQREALLQKRELVIHLLDETRNVDDLAGLRHQLDDFFAGHREFFLVLRGVDDGEIYRTPGPRQVGNRSHSTTFAVPAVVNGIGETNATLTLDTLADDVLLARLALVLGASALGGAFVVSVGSAILVRLGLAPLQSLVDQTRKLAAQTLERRLDASGQPQEVLPLVEQFNGLLERLESAYVQLAGFNADVAHELNTPLSTIITSTELAIRKERDARALREVLGCNLEELNRLSGIVRDMLFLSQAERGTQARQTQIASLSRLANEVMHYHEAALTEANLRTQVIGDADGRFDVHLIQRAISNLLSNATRFAAQGSTVSIRISGSRSGRVSLAVENYGQGISGEHLPRLFDRFYRIDKSRSRSGSHHGLGLSIVDAIARMHGGSTFAQSDQGITSIGFELPLEEQPLVRD